MTREKPYSVALKDLIFEIKKELEAYPFPLDREWMDEKLASQYSCYSVHSLRQFRSKGGGPPFHKCGTKVFYRKSDLDHWLSTFRVKKWGKGEN